MARHRRFTAGAILAIALGLVASAGAETILIPVYLPRPTPGRNGALWQSTLTIENNADEGWPHVAPSGCNTSAEIVISAHSITQNPVCPYGLAMQLVLPDELSDRVSFHLVLRDRNSVCQPAGTAIPVVREADLLRGRSVLLNVPGHHSRHAIRFFNLSDTSPLEFRLRIRLFEDRDDSEPLFETSLTVPPSLGWSGYGASYRVLDAGSGLTDISYGSLWMELVPTSPDVPYWWFASVTDDTTNAVTIVAPN
jgi:hypothetical protein